MGFLKEYSWLFLLVFAGIGAIITLTKFFISFNRKHKQDSCIRVPTDKEKIKYGTPLYLLPGIVIIILAISLLIFFMKVSK